MICGMTSPKGDPTYIKNKEGFFIEVAKTIGMASTHPKTPGGCVLVRDREIIGEGRSILTHTKVEIDPVAHAIATACKRGTPSVGSVIYSTRYPFSASVFQAHIMGVKAIHVLAHDWEPYYKDEFRRAARLARELFISIEPFFDDDDERFSTNDQAPRFDNREEQYENKDLYTYSPATADADVLENYSYPPETNDNSPL